MVPVNLQQGEKISEEFRISPEPVCYQKGPELPLLPQTATGDKSKVRSRQSGDPEGRLMSDCSVGEKKKADRRLMKRSVITVCKLRRKDSTRLAF